MQKEIPKLFANGEDAVAVSGIDQLKGHAGSAFHGIFIAAGRAETAVAAERDEFGFSTVRAAIHGTAESGIAAVYHFLHVFYDRLAWV